ncbi:unnamed protein product [Microthlaspi erraticum]|uniref:Uncharacterized protein n=1 Tax=Microthlaspi erraticum TaxID=1685480 RepID=A0A6D2JTI3_9BRAS|nr:unnamed protein product [Microthlaspi erraticum]
MDSDLYRTDPPWISTVHTTLLLKAGNLAAPVEEWTIGGTALMAVERIHGAPFKKFSSLRQEWALKNRYIPGPIQFTGPLLLELGAQ